MKARTRTTMQQRAMQPIHLKAAGKAKLLEISQKVVYQNINKHSSHCGLYQQTVKASSRKRALLHLLIQPKKHISTETRMGTMKIEHKAY